MFIFAQEIQKTETTECTSVSNANYETYCLNSAFPSVYFLPSHVGETSSERFTEQRNAK